MKLAAFFLTTLGAVLMPIDWTTGYVMYVIGVCWLISLSARQRRTH